jgi:hypothetical protein
VSAQPKLKPCPICGSHYFQASSLRPGCSLECRKELGRQRERKRVAKEARKATRVALDNLKTLSQLCAETQKAVNLYIRIRDFGKGCISCPTGKVTDAGHRFHAGTKYRTSRLRFDHRCLNGQCEDCNRYNGGRPADYDEGYRARYGEAAWQELHELKRQADRGELLPLTKDEVRQIAIDHRRMARELGIASNAAALA